MKRKLVIGYGNPLRTDDSLGLRAAEWLQSLLPKEQCEVIAVHQLTPELSEKIAQAESVAFIDASAASCGQEAGTIRQQKVNSQAAHATGLSHHVSPENLVLLAGSLYGCEPQAVLFTVEAASFDLGETLTPPVRAALPELVRQVRDWVG